jgi:hypothetical protein
MGQEPPTEKEPQKIYLGFGAFQFQLTYFAPDQFTETEYLEFIRADLEAIDGVSALEITSFDPSEQDRQMARPDDIPSFAETGQAIPFAEYVVIEFDLHVPHAVQKELTRNNDVFAFGLGENFHVCIEDGTYRCCAMVWAPEARSQADAASAVEVVREVLSAGNWTQPEAPIVFESLEMTPASFTAHLEGVSASQPQAFKLQELDGSGYYHYRFSYELSKYEDEKSVAKAFFSNILWELDLMYEIVSAGKQQSRFWIEVTIETTAIFDAYENTGVRSSWRRISVGRRINRAMIALARFELFQQAALKEQRSDFQRQYRIEDSNLIQAPVSDVLSTFEAIPVEPLSNLLELFESRRNTARGVAIATLASLIGASVAAVATLIAAG